MSPEFIKANQEALDEREFELLMQDHPQPNMAFENAAYHIGTGMAWLGFWLMLGMAFIAMAMVS